MIIYVITAGDYSDYKIYGVTTNKERAEDMRKKVSCNTGYTGDEANIEEFEDGVFPADSYWAYFDKTVPVKYWFIEFKFTGELVRAFEFWEDSGKQIKFIDINRGRSDAGHVIKYIVASDKEHAIKIARDERAKILAKRYNI